MDNNVYLRMARLYQNKYKEKKRWEEKQFREKCSEKEMNTNENNKKGTKRKLHEAFL